MPRWYCGALVALGCLALVGCAAERAAVSPTSAVTLLRTGLPLLGCREACLAAWRQAEPQAAQLDAAARWPELAALVEGIGFQDDLSLYYLGRAAEGLGYSGAAASYYRQSTNVSGTAISCKNLSKICAGLAFPRAALRRLEVIDRELNRMHYRRPRPALRRPASPEGNPGEAPIPVAGETPPPTPSTTAPVPSAPARPIIAPAAPPSSEYIEPPPAIR